MKASPAVRPLFRSGRSGIIIGILGCGVFTSGLNAQMTDDELSAHDTAFFESKIRPLLIEHCYDCHASDAERIRGGLVLDTREVCCFEKLSPIT